jgi:hypothetical protein
MIDVRSITIRLQPDGLTSVFTGRVAWALACLIDAEATGCTPISHPGPRWSGYVHKLRRAGLSVETIDERHGPPYSGVHARYVLRSEVEILALVGYEVAA